MADFQHASCATSQCNGELFPSTEKSMTREVKGIDCASTPQLLTQGTAKWHAWQPPGLQPLQGRHFIWPVATLPPWMAVQNAQHQSTVLSGCIGCCDGEDGIVIEESPGNIWILFLAECWSTYGKHGAILRLLFVVRDSKKHVTIPCRSTIYVYMHIYFKYKYEMYWNRCIRMRAHVDNIHIWR